MAAKIVEAFYESVLRAPDGIALITERSQMSFKDLLRLIHLFDVQLKSRGVREGDTIVLAVDKSEFAIAFSFLLSVRAFKVIFSPVSRVVNAGLEYDRVVLTEASDLVPEEKQIVVDSDWFTVMSGLPDPDYGSVTAEQGSFIVATSGTTGTPKFVETSEASRFHDLMNMLPRSREETRSIRFMTTASPNTGLALNTNLAVILCGGSVVALTEDSSKALQYINLWHVTHLVTMPAVLVQALKIPNAGQFLVSLREIEIGGAYVPPSLLEAIFGLCKATVVTSFGATETGAVCRATRTRNEELSEGYVGELFRDDIEAVFFDEKLEERSEINEGILGFRFVSEASKSYFGGGPETEIFGFRKNVFITGDIARREGDALFVLGRVKRVLNLNGAKFSLDAIQGYLRDQLPTAKDVAVAATRDGQGLEQLLVFVAGDTPIDPKSVNQLLGQRWRNLHAGRVIQLRDLPLTQAGKVDLAALSALVSNETAK